MRRVAIIGAGPIGLEAALEARRRGHQVSVYEAGRAGQHFRQYGDVGLFTPFRGNSTEHGRTRLAQEGVRLPSPDALLTAREFAERYLDPLARLPELRGALREGTRVGHVARSGLRKPEGIAAAGDGSRAGRPFLLLVEGREGPRFEQADVLIDASGVYASPNATGPGGLPAAGEESLGDRIERHLPAIRGDARPRYAGARVLLLGDGHSAATALVQLAALARGGGGTSRVHWLHGETEGDVWPVDPADPLPARAALLARANEAATERGWLTRHAGATVLAYDARDPAAVRVTLRDRRGSEFVLEVDRVLALVGYRPDILLTREIHMHLCYASEGPMALASALLRARLADASAVGDCLSQRSQGPEALRSPEPDFFVLGAKSYGRNPHFLLSIGHEQICDALDLVGPRALPRHAA